MDNVKVWIFYINKLKLLSINIECSTNCFTCKTIASNCLSCENIYDLREGFCSRCELGFYYLESAKICKPCDSDIAKCKSCTTEP